jgi:hypothetical protein
VAIQGSLRELNMLEWILCCALFSVALFGLLFPKEEL